MTKIRWHLKITIDSSTRERVEQVAQEDRRSSGNYIRVLIEKDLRNKEKRDDPPRTS